MGTLGGKGFKTETRLSVGIEEKGVLFSNSCNYYKFICQIENGNGHKNNYVSLKSIKKSRQFLVRAAIELVDVYSYYYMNV